MVLGKKWLAAQPRRGLGLFPGSSVGDLNVHTAPTEKSSMHRWSPRSSRLTMARERNRIDTMRVCCIHTRLEGERHCAECWLTVAPSSLVLATFFFFFYRVCKVKKLFWVDAGIEKIFSGKLWLFNYEQIWTNYQML